MLHDFLFGRYKKIVVGGGIGFILVQINRSHSEGCGGGWWHEHFAPGHGRLKWLGLIKMALLLIEKGFNR